MFLCSLQKILIIHKFSSKAYFGISLAKTLGILRMSLYPYQTSLITGDSTKFLNEAMKQGYVNVKLVKVVVVGPAGVGKTSLLYLLLSKDPPPPDTRTSTGCAERSIRVIRISQWSEISTKEFEEMIAEAVPVLCEELKAKGTDYKATINKVTRKLVELVRCTSISGSKKQNKGKVSAAEASEKEGSIWGGEERKDSKGWEKEEGSNRENISEKTTTTISADERKKVIEEVMEKLAGLVRIGKKSRRLLDIDLIYLTDSGGQQAYWDLFPVFSYDASATLFVHRLCDKLDEHPLNDLYQSGKQVGPSQRATLTTAEAFKIMLQGLHKEGQQSKIITVGTHRDMAGDCEESPEEKNKKLADIASPHFNDDVVYCNEGMEEIVFQVNTKNPDSNDEKEATKIRACIEKSAREHKIPIWWFILQLILEAQAIKLGREVLSKEEVIGVSNSLGFPEGELDAALTFFDKLNIFLYKKSILPDVVFTNAQVPLDILSKLVEKQYHLRVALANPTKAADHATTGDWKKFRDHGTLTLHFLKEFEDHYVEGLFTAGDFLLLLEKSLVVSRLSTTEYFFPAILNMTTEAKINECLESCKSNKIAALVVEFPTGWAPPGVYCCSLCHLQSHSGWEVVKNQRMKTKKIKASTSPQSYSGQNPPLPTSPLPPKSKISTASDSFLSRNCIEFIKIDQPGSMTFIDNFSFFAVCVNVDTSKMQPDELKHHCQTIKSEVLAAVEAALINTHHEDTHPTVAFLCPEQNEICSTELHVAHLSRNQKQWICSENNEVFDTLTPDHALWLSTPG